MDEPLRRRIASAGEELAAALLPELFADLGAARQAYESLSARIDRAPERTLADERRLGVLETMGASNRELGWCLGVLACATGADLLLARRERDGLRPLVRLVAAALARRGVELAPDTDRLPCIASTVGGGWELPFALALLFWRAGVALGAGTLSWDLDRAGERWCLRLPHRGGWEEELESLLPDIETHVAEGWRSVVLPNAWLAA